MPEGSFEGKTVIVRGIGADDSAGHAIARAFARRQANLVLVASSKSRLKAAKSLEEEFGVEVACVHCSHEDADSIEDVINDILERFGRLDVLVNAALVGTPQLLRDVKPQGLERVLFACTVVPFAWMRACMPHLSASHGTIISLGSRFAETGLEGLGALATATQGFAALCAVAAREWEALGINVNIVQAAVRNVRFEKCEVEFAGELDERDVAMCLDDLRNTHDELCQTCLFLASAVGHRVTGQVIRI